MVLGVHDCVAFSASLPRSFFLIFELRSHLYPLVCPRPLPTIIIYDCETVVKQFDSLILKLLFGSRSTNAGCRTLIDFLNEKFPALGCHKSLINRGYYLPVCGYEFHLRVVNSIPHSFTALTREIHQVEHEKIKFISISEYVIFCLLHKHQ